LEDTLQTTILLLGIALFAVAAYSDIRTFLIPNALVAAVAALGFLRLIVIGDPSTALYTVGACILVFIVTFLLFWRGLLGGGDAKLIPATVLLVGYHDLVPFLFLMSVCGVLVSLAILIIHRKARLAVPYGVAIAGGGIVTLLFQPSLLG
jgi:prepilin peptidase CpaA